MGHGQDSSRLTLARVKKLAEEIKSIGERSRKRADCEAHHSYILGGLESVLAHLVGETGGAEARALIEAAFDAACAPPPVAAREQVAEVAL